MRETAPNWVVLARRSVPPPGQPPGAIPIDSVSFAHAPTSNSDEMARQPEHPHGLKTVVDGFPGQGIGRRARG